MTAILAVRHAQASFGADDYDSLSPRGEQQARLLGEWLRHIGYVPERVVTGGLTRHAQTARLCLNAMGLDAMGVAVEPMAAFAEFSAADVIAQHDPTFHTRHLTGDVGREAFRSVFAAAVDRWVCGRYDDDYALSWPDFRMRVCTAVTKLEGDAVLLFTSGGPLTVLLQAATGATATAAFESGFGLFNGSLSRFTSVEGRLYLRSFNAVPHLETVRDKDFLTYI